MDWLEFVKLSVESLKIFKEIRDVLKESKNAVEARRHLASLSVSQNEELSGVIRTLISDLHDTSDLKKMQKSVADYEETHGMTEKSRAAKDLLEKAFDRRRKPAAKARRKTIKKKAKRSVPNKEGVVKRKVVKSSLSKSHKLSEGRSTKGLRSKKRSG